MDKRVNLLFVILFTLASAAWGQNDTVHGVRTVVIDPGHGGKDPGCHGQAGAKEKHVCLAIALKLGAAIEKKYPGVKVVYTRKTDVFVELQERADIANKHDADLFICIHANSASPSAYGAETYVLGLHRSEDNLKVMERENSVILLEDDGGKKYQDIDMSPDYLAMLPYLQAVKLENSRDFATQVQGQFTSLGRKDRGVRQAGFLVLRQTTMPGVLIETGFLTNQAEEAFLKEEKNQEKMAGAIFEAFDDYKQAKDSVAALVNKGRPKEKVEDKEPEPVFVEDSTGIVFRVQVETSENRLKPDHIGFKGYKVHEYSQFGFYKYTIGYFRSYKDALDYQRRVRESDFPGAFVVAFEDGVRMKDLSEAKRRTQ